MSEKRDKFFGAFNKFSSGSVYLRNNELKEIKNFLNSRDNILHIHGRPGTGKTLCVKHVLANKRHIFYNAYSDALKIFKIKSNHTTKIFVIDEFDIFEEQYKDEVKKILKNIQLKNKKLITISNYLGNSENNLIFKPYTPQEIEQIIMLKLKKEVKEEILQPVQVKLLSKKCTDGDLRKAFDMLLDEIENRNNENTLSEDNIHKKIIKNILFKTQRKNISEMYNEYLIKCNEIKIKAYERNDFISLCDIL
ncbi:hypothetical protein H312_02312 [Anncaliia algerae PRA339]|uniref:Cdc6/ORC1-like ATPase lid domain-containing protein n=1 Tax=Anncaliia algerae PRA339 TaxID=1288291 RepID=A0A059EYZ8_9MICR|nr:hypothetical protein H312_02312 [Anncaliia algerae PRA339]